eukprot:comp4640_c0_seq2/m.3399 comp4640_c0_seq2/g.3399  ORF comp4640_c0_seq2/g.3399 comp4640_c0_seq2/m.3399 type:complete len:409 (+) comp4640_c0_seq2:245-1471(+)
MGLAPLALQLALNQMRLLALGCARTPDLLEPRGLALADQPQLLLLQLARTRRSLLRSNAAVVHLEECVVAVLEALDSLVALRGLLAQRSLLLALQLELAPPGLFALVLLLARVGGNLRALPVELLLALPLGHVALQQTLLLQLAPVGLACGMVDSDLPPPFHQISHVLALANQPNPAVPRLLLVHSHICLRLCTAVAVLGAVALLLIARLLSDPGSIVLVALDLGLALGPLLRSSTLAVNTRAAPAVCSARSALARHGARGRWARSHGHGARCMQHTVRLCGNACRNRLAELLRTLRPRSVHCTLAHGHRCTLRSRSDGPDRSLLLVLLLVMAPAHIPIAVAHAHIHLFMMSRELPNRLRNRHIAVASKPRWRNVQNGLHWRPAACVLLLLMLLILVLLLLLVVMGRG